MNADRNHTSSAGQKRAPQGAQAAQKARPQEGQPQAGQRPASGGAPTQRPHMQSSRKKKINPRCLSKLRGTILLVGSLILLLGMLLAILPMFKLQTIEVSGTEHYTEEQILEKAGITVGDEMLAIDLNKVRDSLLDHFEYIESVTVRSVFPSTVKIEIVEKSNVAYLWHEGEFYSFDSQFRVLEKSSDEGTFAGFTRVDLPETVSVNVGETIVFANPNIDMSYVFTLLEEMKTAELLPYVTLLDCEQKYENAIELNGNCRIEIGKVSDIPSKLELAQQILVNKGLAEGQCVVLNVSDMSKSTYRLLSQTDFLTIG